LDLIIQCYLNSVLGFYILKTLILRIMDEITKLENLIVHAQETTMFENALMLASSFFAHGRNWNRWGHGSTKALLHPPPVTCLISWSHFPSRLSFL
jgi:hypothetical protein